MERSKVGGLYEVFGGIMNVSNGQRKSPVYLLPTFGDGQTKVGVQVVDSNASATAKSES